MNCWWNTHAYQQSNEISPPSATDSTRSASVTTAIYVDHGLNRHKSGPTWDSVALAVMTTRVGALTTAPAGVQAVARHDARPVSASNAGRTSTVS